MRYQILKGDLRPAELARRWFGPIVVNREMLMWSILLFKGIEPLDILGERCNLEAKSKFCVPPRSRDQPDQGSCTTSRTV